MLFSKPWRVLLPSNSAATQPLQKSALVSPWRANAALGAGTQSAEPRPPSPPAAPCLPACLPAVRVKRNSLHLPPWTWITPPPLAEQQGHGQQQQQAGAATAAAGSAQQAGDRGGSGVAAAAAAGQVATAAKGAVEALLGEDGRPDLELMERVSAYPATKSWGRADTAPKVGLGWRGRGNGAVGGLPAAPPACMLLHAIAEANPCARVLARRLLPSSSQSAQAPDATAPPTPRHRRATACPARPSGCCRRWRSGCGARRASACSTLM